MLNRGCGDIAAWPINWNPKKWCKISSIHSPKFLLLHWVRMRAWRIFSSSEQLMLATVAQ